MRPVDPAVFVADLGLEGCRHAKPKSRRQVLLMEEETLVELWVTGPCHPCGLMDDIRDGLQEELRGRRGVLAWVKAGGRVRVGDRIEATPPEEFAGDDATVQKQRHP
jgi:MOSC domain-containing protein YiiM